MLKPGLTVKCRYSDLPKVTLTAVVDSTCNINAQPNVHTCKTCFGERGKTSLSYFEKVSSDICCMFLCPLIIVCCDSLVLPIEVESENLICFIYWAVKTKHLANFHS